MLRYLKEKINEYPCESLLILYSVIILSVVTYWIIRYFIPSEYINDYFISYMCTLYGSYVAIGILIVSYSYEKDKDKRHDIEMKNPNIAVDINPKKVENGELRSININITVTGPGIASDVTIKYFHNGLYKYKYVGFLSANKSIDIEIFCNNNILNKPNFIYFSDIDNKVYYFNIFISKLKDCKTITENTIFYTKRSPVYPSDIDIIDNNIEFTFNCEKPLTHKEYDKIKDDLTDLFNKYSIPVNIVSIKGDLIICKINGMFSENLIQYLIKENCGLDVYKFTVISGDKELL